MIVKFHNLRDIIFYMNCVSFSFSEDGNVCFQFIIGTTKVCLLAWLAVLGVPRSTFYAIRKKFLGNLKHWYDREKSVG